MTSGGRALRSLLLGLSIGLPLSACGNDDGGNDGGAGSSATAGAPTAGSSGAASAGTSTAGSNSGAGTGNAGSSAAGSGMGGSGQAGGSGGGGASQGGGGTGPVVGAHCMGGDVLVFPNEVFSDFGGPMSNCLGYKTGATGIQPGPELSVRDIELATPLTANQPYAFSLKVTLAPGDKSNTIEIWSADEKCGVGQEKLYEGVFEMGILCMELKPTANHSRLLMAWKGEGSQGSTDIAICPGGSCGN